MSHKPTVRLSHHRTYVVVYGGSLSMPYLIIVFNNPIIFLVAPKLDMRYIPLNFYSCDCFMHAIPWWSRLMFGPSVLRETSGVVLSVPARFPYLLWPLLTSPLYQPVVTETSLGKVYTLWLIAAGSTTLVTPAFSGIWDVDMMCYLIQPHSLLSGSCSSVPTTQSGLLQCLDHSKPPCHLLCFEVSPPRSRDLHPLGHSFKELYLPFKAHTPNKRH